MTQSTQNRAATLMKLPPPLHRLLLQCCAYTAACLGLELLLGLVLHWHLPYNYPAGPITAVYGDFREFIPKFARFHSARFFDAPALPYPPAALVAYKLFLPAAAIRHHALGTATFVLFILITSWIMLAFVYRALTRRGLAPRSAALFLGGLYVTSFPFWFLVHQANIEVTVWIALSLALWAHWTGRSTIAAVCFGLAIALKLYPVLFLGLFIARRQYRQLAFSLIVAAVATLASLWLVCPDIAYSWRMTSATLFSMGPDFILRTGTSGFDHTLYALLKACLPAAQSPSALHHLLTIYLIAACLIGTTLYVTRIRKLPTLNQILCLTIAAVLLPPVSFDYTLIHLYAPLLLLAFYVLTHPYAHTKPIAAMLALFAFLLSAQSEFIAHGLRFGGQLKALALIALFVLALIYPFDLEPLEIPTPTPVPQ